MDLPQYYGEVEGLTRTLRLEHRPDLADRVDGALRRGATSGEILGELTRVLPDVAAALPSVAARSEALADWARRALP